MTVHIRPLRVGDGGVLDHVDPDVFDDPIDPGRLVEFLEDPRHHLVVAVDQGVVVGFASGVHYIHPDKAGADLFVNEIGVAESHQRHGIARNLMQALFEEGRSVGCTEAWVLTARTNEPAKRLYLSFAEAREDEGPAMFTFKL